MTIDNAFDVFVSRIPVYLDDEEIELLRTAFLAGAAWQLEQDNENIRKIIPK